MNKTVNINLAGVFFHIDEDAYAKLRRYLEAIKRTFGSSQGGDEIIADIEARIAELFHERIKETRQVVNMTDVDHVIEIMGQPEDYRVDEDLFEEETYTEPSSKRQKRLYRDPENGYVGGVISGLRHYLGIEAIWLRILWVLLTILTQGAFLIIYIIFWIFAKEARTTAEKLDMRGEPVNIDNIQRKVQEEIDYVADKVRDVDYKKYASRAKSTSSSFFDGIGSVISALLNIFIKFVGILLILISATTLIALFIGLFSVGTFGLIDAPWIDYVDAANIGAPLWLVSLFSFFAIAIPFFVLFVVGLKILVNNLKSIGTPAKIALIVVWVVSILALIFLGIRQATVHAFDGEVTTTKSLNLQANDTLRIQMNTDTYYARFRGRNNDFKITTDAEGNNIIKTNDVRLIVRSTSNPTGRIELVKMAEGSSPTEAREFAEYINYSYKLSDNTLVLETYLETEISNKFRDQKVQVIVYLPVGSILYADQNTYNYHRSSSFYGDLLENGQEEEYLLIKDEEIQCLTCPEDTNDDWNDDNWDENWDNDNTPEGEDGVEASIKINDKEVKIEINDDGIKANGENVKSIKIDENGVEIKKTGNDNSVY
ncbi:PspC domain-containing protein [Gangjinia marincola]|uniref:PspC domain-containing protein n=1 Tax=Gangjinia marincola TaxID=578463 RepID=A0ABP3XRE7_9FLAO